MKHWFKKLARRIAERLILWAKYDDDAMVCYLIIYISSLEIPKDAWLEFAPIPLYGMTGPFKLTGCSLPVFTYTVFERSIMEFIRVTVEISKPGRIEFKSHILSADKEEDGKEVEPCEKYKEPFFMLAMHLMRYFPYHRDVFFHVSTPKVKMML